MSEISRFTAELEGHLTPYLPEEQVQAHVREAADHLKSAAEDGVPISQSLGSARKHAHQIIESLGEGRGAKWWRVVALVWPVLAVADVLWRFILDNSFPIQTTEIWMSGFALVLIASFLGRRPWAPVYASVALLVVAVSYGLGSFGSVAVSGELGNGFLPRRLAQAELEKRRAELPVAEKLINEAEAFRLAFTKAKAPDQLPQEVALAKTKWNPHFFESRLRRLRSLYGYTGTTYADTRIDFATAERRWAMRTESGWRGRLKVIQAENQLLEASLNQTFSHQAGVKAALPTALAMAILLALQLLGGKFGQVLTRWQLRRNHETRNRSKPAASS